MNVRWSPDAYSDLEAIGQWLLAHDPALFDSTIERLLGAVEFLGRFPYQGRPAKLPGVRELIMSPLPYLILYRVHEDAVEIIRILHGAQNREL